MNFNLFHDQMATLPVFIYYSYTQPGSNPEILQGMAWGAALVLIIIVMALNLVARLAGQVLRPADRALRGNHGQRASTSPTWTSTTATSSPSRASTMTIPARSVTALIGPSGCGKSTFLRTLNRMHEVIPGARVEGKIVVDGHSLYDAAVDPVEVRRQIGMVFQRPNPFPTMSIADNVLAGLRLNNKRLKKSDAEAVVERSLHAREPVEGGQGPAEEARHVRSPAVSSSGSASPARSRSSRRCC